MITVWARNSASWVRTTKGRTERSTAINVEADLGAEALGLHPELLHQLRSHDPLREARVVLDIGGQHQLPPLRLPAKTSGARLARAA